MHLRLAVALACLAVAGCAAPNDPSPDPAADAAAAPAPVDIHEVLNLVEGATDSWAFEVHPNATAVEIRFFATSKAVVGTGLPICLSHSTPDGEGSAGSCGGPGNVQLAPSVVMLERVFYAKGIDAKPGHYAFTLDAQPNAVDFHAYVQVTYE